MKKIVEYSNKSRFVMSDLGMFLNNHEVVEEIDLDEKISKEEFKKLCENPHDTKLIDKHRSECKNPLPKYKPTHVLKVAPERLQKLDRPSNNSLES